MYIYDNTCDMYIYNKENVMLMTICYFCDYENCYEDINLFSFNLTMENNSLSFCFIRFVYNSLHR